MLKKLLMVVAMSTVAVSAFAADLSQVKKSFELKDGSTVYIFKDGKMAMEDKYGNSASMQSGHVMETKDGKKIIMEGNELWRIQELLHKGHVPG